jgi:hypothetical protein
MSIKQSMLPIVNTSSISFASARRPGMIFTPACFASVLDPILFPSASIAEEGGPIQVIFASVKTITKIIQLSGWEPSSIFAKVLFSERKP